MYALRTLLEQMIEQTPVAEMVCPQRLSLAATISWLADGLNRRLDDGYVSRQLWHLTLGLVTMPHDDSDEDSAPTTARGLLF